MLKLPLQVKLIIPLVLFFLIFFHALLSFSSKNYSSSLTLKSFKNPIVSNPSHSSTWYKGVPVSQSLRHQPSLSHSLNTTSTSTSRRSKAAFVILCRSTDLNGIIDSIRSLEDRFNKRYHYPYIFLSEEEFTPDFISRTTAFIENGGSRTPSYGLIPQDQWQVPLDWVDVEKMKNNMEYLSEKVPYGNLLSYRAMCRYQSGFFWRHPLLDELEYYWRVEPNVKFLCDIEYDPFIYMEENNKKYSFTITIKEYEVTIPSLWSEMKKFISKNPQYLAKPNSMNWISSDRGETYNLCHFWSNFEIASLSLWRSEAYTKYFEPLDKSGGFFEERWGDAPVHSIAAALFLKPDEIHFFGDIGYRHEPYQQCPVDKVTECACNPNDSFENHWYSCTQSWKKFRTFG